MQGFVRPKLIPLVMSVAGVLAMLYLGFWQLERLAWKRDLIARIEQGIHDAPLQQLPATDAERKAQHFHYVMLTGYYMNKPEFHIAARYYKSKLGYSVLTPFIVDEGPDTGKIILVNRGWIPAALKDDKASYATITDEKITIKGRIRLSNERNTFTPENQPEKNMWFGRDAAEMAKHARLEFEPLTLDIVGDQDTSTYPVPADEKVQLRNDHLAYAFTWFSIGLAIFVISLLYHRKPKPKTDDQP